jgi:hypothetical protein
LGFFRALDAAKQRAQIRSKEQLIQAVVHAFENYSPIQLDNIWISFQQCMLEILKINGDNTYKVPHMSKTTLARLDELPKNLNVPLEIYENVLNQVGEGVQV